MPDQSDVKRSIDWAKIRAIFKFDGDLWRWFFATVCLLIANAYLGWSTANVTQAVGQMMDALRMLDQPLFIDCFWIVVAWFSVYIAIEVIEELSSVVKECSTRHIVTRLIVTFFESDKNTNHGKKHPGDDAQAVGEAPGHAIKSVLKILFKGTQALTIIAAQFSLLYGIDPSIAEYLMLYAVIGMLIPLFFQPAISDFKTQIIQAETARRERFARVNKNFDVWKTYDQVKGFVSELCNDTTDIQNMGLKKILVTLWPEILGTCYQISFYVVPIYILSNAYFAGQIDFATIFMIQVALSMLSGAIDSLQHLVLSEYTKLNSSIALLDQNIQTVTPICSQTIKTPCSPSNVAVTDNQELIRVHPKQPDPSDKPLELEFGQAYALIAESGWGKTMLMEQLAGISHGLGEYTIDPLRSDGCSYSYMPVAFPFRFANGSIHQELSCNENPSTNDIQKIDNWLAQLNIKKVPEGSTPGEHKKPNQCSSAGEQKRLNLIRTLFRYQAIRAEPGKQKKVVILLDEPLANLDGNTKRVVKDFIDEQFIKCEDKKLNLVVMTNHEQWSNPKGVQPVNLAQDYSWTRIQPEIPPEQEIAPYCAS